MFGMGGRIIGRPKTFNKHTKDDPLFLKRILPLILLHNTSPPGAMLQIRLVLTTKQITTSDHSPAPLIAFPYIPFRLFVKINI